MKIILLQTMDVAEMNDEARATSAELKKRQITGGGNIFILCDIATSRANGKLTR